MMIAHTSHESAKLHHNSNHCQIAVVIVMPGETAEEAWHRHVGENPEDKQAMTRIFHFPLHYSGKKNVKRNYEITQIGDSF